MSIQWIKNCVLLRISLYLAPHLQCNPWQLIFCFGFLLILFYFIFLVMEVLDLLNHSLQRWPSRINTLPTTQLDKRPGRLPFGGSLFQRFGLIFITKHASHLSFLSWCFKFPLVCFKSTNKEWAWETLDPYSPLQ